MSVRRVVVIAAAVLVAFLCHAAFCRWVPYPTIAYIEGELELADQIVSYHLYPQHGVARPAAIVFGVIAPLLIGLAVFLWLTRPTTSA